jgi:hypothetical protein
MAQPHSSRIHAASLPTSIVTDRRQFLAASAAAAALVGSPRTMVFGAPSRQSPAETLIAELYQSLSSEQRAVVAKAWDDPLRNKVNANWHVTKPRIGEAFYSPMQREMVDKIVRNLTSPAGYQRLKDQTEDDDGGLEAYSMAWFGQPEGEKFEWMLTGRHLTLRADGNCQDQLAFGGPIVYGHGYEGAPKDNLFYYQTEKVQRVFDSLTESQKAKALLSSNPPAEAKVDIQGQQGRFTGLAAAELTDEQRELFRQALATIFSLYRDEDSAEVMELMERGQGLRAMHLAYFSKNDLLNDGIWDIWRIEGPSAVVHFRGAPHVHAYIHVQAI